MTKNKSAKNKNKTPKPAPLRMVGAETEAVGMTKAECLIWRDSDVRFRIRAAIARWAGVSSSAIVSTQQLKQLAPPNDGPWSIAQQNNLIAFTNNSDPPVFHSVVPDDDESQMEPLDHVVSGDTTVLEWEDIVWRNQNPRTFCNRMFGL